MLCGVRDGMEQLCCYMKEEVEENMQMKDV